MSAPNEAELDAVGKLIDVLEGLGVAADLPGSEQGFAAQVLRGGLLENFAGIAAQLVGLIASADPGAALVQLERKTAELFIDSLLAALWKLDYPAAAALKPSAAAALGAAPNRIAVLEFLAGEAAAARIIAADSYDPDSAAAVLLRIVSSLGVSEAVAAAEEVSGALGLLEAEVKRIVADLPADYLGEVLLDPKTLGEDGVGLLRKINAHLASDYGTRRALLLQRFEREEELHAALQQYKEEYISPPAEIGMEQVWAARSELARVQKTNVHAEAIESSLKDVLIGRVPDRGGRVDAASGASKLEAQGARRDAAVAVKYGAAGPSFKARSGGGGGRGGGYDHSGGRDGGRQASHAAAAGCYKCGQPGHQARDCNGIGMGGAVSKPGGGGGGGAAGSKSSGAECHECGAAGHLKRDCPRLQQSRQQQKQRRPKADDSSSGTVTITLASGGELTAGGSGDGEAQKPSGKRVQGGFQSGKGKGRGGGGSQDADGAQKGGRSRGGGRGRGRGGGGGRGRGRGRA